MFRSFKIATGKWKHHSLVIMETIIIFQFHGSPYQVLLRHRDACKKNKKVEPLILKNWAQKELTYFKLKFFFKAQPRAGEKRGRPGEGAGRKREKCLPAMPMNLPNTPQLVATDCFSGNAFAPNENLVHLFFQTPQIYSYSNGNKAVWMPKSIALQNMTALQANSGLILFTSKLTEFLQNSVFTYRKYSKQCSPVFNSRHNNDTLLTILLPYAHDTLGCHSSES